jgi:PAS domain S-box-containing protein
MTRQAPSLGNATSSILPIATAAFAIGIFIADTFTHFEIAVPVLYVAVVLMAARFCQARGVLLVSAGCVGLTVFSFFLSPPTGPAVTAIINTLISILTVGLTTFLVLRSQSSQVALQEQANLLGLTHDAIFVRNMQNVITYWNRGAEESYGWTAEEVVGKVTTHQLLQTIFSAPVQEIDAELLRTGRWEGELIHTKRDGTHVKVASRWSLQRDKGQRPLAILETNNDITDRKRTEDALRRQANLLEQTHDAIIVWEFSGTIIFWNRGAEQLYGFSRKEAVGRHSHDLLQTMHPLSRPDFEAELERAGEWKGELTHTAHGGRKILVESRHVLIREPDGRRLVLETNRDITEQKRAAGELRQAQADLAHASRVTTMGELTASLAHEVNQPIAAAITDANTCLRWLARDHPDLEEGRAAAVRVVKDATRAADIISRIRLLFKKGTPERESVNVNEVIQEMLVLLNNEATRYFVSVRTELASDLPQVKADRVQLQQVIMNLMMNSIDAMKDGDGTRDLAIQSQRTENEQLMVSVSDTGVGLPSQHADRMFDAFFTTKLHGTGMGLAISRSIIESHGGRLWAADNSPRGASFYFTLPTTEAHP